MLKYPVFKNIISIVFIILIIPERILKFQHPRKPTEAMNYYLKRKRKILRYYDRISKQLDKVLAEHFGRDDTAQIITAARSELEKLIPVIPYIGGSSNPFFTNMLVESAIWLALYKSLKNFGQDDEITGEIILRSFTLRVQSWPEIIRKILNHLTFATLTKLLLKKRALESQHRLYPDNWVFTYTRGNGKIFDYKVEYTECAICKFYNKHDAGSMVRYCCMQDFILSDALGWGLKRNMTIAEGYGKCDFSFKQC